MVEIQADQYGGGDPRVDACRTLLADDARARARDPSRVRTSIGSRVTLATVNLMSFFGLHRDSEHRRWGICGLRDDLVHPNRLYGDGLRRLGYGEDVTLYFMNTSRPTRSTGRSPPIDMAGVNRRRAGRGPTSCSAPAPWRSTTAGPTTSWPRGVEARLVVEGERLGTAPAAVAVVA